MPLINNYYGNVDTPQLCKQVDNLKAVAAKGLKALLTWSAPTIDEDSSFVGTRIVRKVGSVPKNKSDGTVIYEGTEFTYTDTGLTEGITYYYRAFAYNIKMEYQTAMRAVSMTDISYEPNFADNTWDLIIKACQSGSVPDSWVVGNSKPMTIDGVNYQVDIIGKNHDTYTAGGIAPLTFGMHDCYGTKYPMNSSGTNSTGWNDSEMRTETLPAILAKMPENIQNGIRAVNKLTMTSGTNSTIKTASDKLFIFSEMEVYGSEEHSESGEGKQYDYYKAGNSKVKKVGGTDSWWWLRSPIASTDNRFCAVSLSGSINMTLSNAGNSNGVCFGFCF